MRAKNSIFEISICNNFEFFVTLTLDGKKYDRKDLNKYNKDLNCFIANYNKKHNLQIKRLLIPEEHKDGSWHMHGLILGIPKSHLRKFKADEKLPYYILNKILDGQEVYEWVEYRQKFGFNDIEEIRSLEACSKYITKYITKTLFNTTKEVNGHLYYVSRGLKRAEVIKKGRLNRELSQPDFINDFVKIKWFDVNMSDIID